MRARRGTDLLRLRLQPQAAEQVVGRRRGDEREDDAGEQEARHEALVVTARRHDLR